MAFLKIQPSRCQIRSKMTIYKQTGNFLSSNMIYCMMARLYLKLLTSNCFGKIKSFFSTTFPILATTILHSAKLMCLNNIRHFCFHLSPEGFETQKNKNWD